jgi:phosphoglycolate phosphatase
VRALLFDIDGTLTAGGGAGSRALGRALHTRPRATEELRNMRLDGMTDRWIARALLATEGDPSVALPERMKVVTGAEIDGVLEKYLVALEAACLEHPYRPLPGIPELLQALQKRSDVIIGLCTGNVERGAELKLRSAGLWGPFRFGGYGNDAEPRGEIVKAAWQRAQALGAKDALVIGETPRDILAAHDAGLPVCAVATGRFTVHDLAEHGAEVVVESFADTAASERLLAGPLH